MSVPTITKIGVASPEHLDIDVQEGQIYPDLGFDGKQLYARDAPQSELYDGTPGRLIYDTTKNGPAKFPIACARLSFFSVLVTGIRIHGAGTWFRLEIRCPQSNVTFRNTYFLTQKDFGPDGSKWFRCRLADDHNPLFRNSPFAVRETIEFSILYGLSEPRLLVAQSVPMELYVLPQLLPDYFKTTRGDWRDPKRIPLLLLRMFALPASRARLQTEQDWVAMVTKICFGTMLPETGEKSLTKHHWLKYNVWNGSSSFIRDNDKAVVDDTRLGGDFLLPAWLWAYRLWKSKKVTTMVNCYDQAGIVEVALSLGIDVNKIVWEFHQPYGFLPSADPVDLVGWGPCNSPFFKGDVSKMLLRDPKDKDRQSFWNHAFAVWHPDFNPDKDFFKQNKDPRKFEQFQMLAIDACAGPHFGSELRGIWKEPWELKAGGDKTYANMRDYNYDHAKFDTAEHLRPDLSRIIHKWTPGIMGLAADTLPANVYFPYDDPFKGQWKKYAPPEESPFGTQVYGGKVRKVLQHFEDNFGDYTQEQGQWRPVPIIDVNLNHNSVCQEAKVYEPGDKAVRYYSVRISVEKDYETAYKYLHGCAIFALLTSTLEIDRIRSMTINGSGYKCPIVYLTAEYQCIFLYNNLVVEIAGTAVQTKLERTVVKVADQLSLADMVERGKWKDAAK